MLEKQWVREENHRRIKHSMQIRALQMRTREFIQYIYGIRMSFVDLHYYLG